jgi:glucan 1,3-beta-glucosidase
VSTSYVGSYHSKLFPASLAEIKSSFSVNLGGWLVLEPFISPALYEPYQPTNPNFSGIRAVDEWTLCQAIAANKSSGGVAKVIENHYATFITEEDFAEIAGAGLNWVRIPLPYWAVEKFDDEPFLEGVAWK